MSGMTSKQIETSWYQALVESAPDAFVLIDSEGEILLVNQQAENLFGYERAQLLGKKVEALVPERFRGNHHIHRDSYFGEPKVREMGAGLDLWGLRKNGTEFPVEISLSPVLTGNGNCVAAAIRDATSRKRGQEQFRNLLETAPDAMVIINTDGEIVLVNRQTEAVFGYTREALVGKRVEILIPERLRERHASHRRQYFAEPTVRGMGAGLELTGRRKDGREFPIEISLSPMETEGGNWAIAAVRDVTERKEVDLKIAEYARNLERSNKELEQFAYVASHDLQAPLRNIVSFSQLLKDECVGKISNNADEYFRFIEEGSLRMQALIADVMELSRVNKSARPHDWVSMNDVADQACSQLAVTIEEKNAEVLYANLPNVWGESTMLVQLLQNLISNGIKFQTEGRRPRVEIRWKAESNFHCFEVHDNGIGVPSDQLDKVFEVFRRLHTREQFEGTGIGLALCKKIVEEQHRGRIWLESSEGCGARIFFTLPGGPCEEQRAGK